MRNIYSYYRGRVSNLSKFNIDFKDNTHNLCATKNMDGRFNWKFGIILQTKGINS